MIELIKEKDGSYYIRKGILRKHCVIDKLSVKDLAILMRKIDKVVNKGI